MNPSNTGARFAPIVIVLALSGAARAQTASCVPTLSSEEVVVRRGDTLGQLVVDRFFNVLEDPQVREELKLWGNQGMVAQAATANGIRNPDRIVPGQRLRLPDPASCNTPQATPTPTPTPGGQQAPEPQQPDPVVTPAPTATPTPAPIATPPPQTVQPRQPSMNRLLAAIGGALVGGGTSYLMRGWLRSIAQTSRLGAIAAVAIPVVLTAGTAWAAYTLADRSSSGSSGSAAPDPEADVPGDIAAATAGGSTRTDLATEPGIGFDEDLRNAQNFGGP